MRDDTVTARAKSNCLPPDWGLPEDFELVGTRGRYARIAALSNRLGVSETALIKRWHLVRHRAADIADAVTGSAARRKRQAEADAAAWDALRGAVPPTMWRICTLLRQEGPMAAADLARRLGVSNVRISQAVTDSRPCMAATGWRIGRVGALKGGQLMLVHTGERAG